MENEITTLWVLIAGFAGMLLGALMTAAFYELKAMIERRDGYGETL